ncbi:hypothetical protein EW026_g5445 [Hermanssonia centrifuga]|uniref:Uncharacterized protein n=1 Tax=Hermanssonia centrifuga TaxID=98765 RepID=A0A4S4KE08_9APHY|nr:hypothetical protein EW026_g5445 [Hermanssonia centrifuga]
MLTSNEINDIVVTQIARLLVPATEEEQDEGCDQNDHTSNHATDNRTNFYARNGTVVLHWR